MAAENDESSWPSEMVYQILQFGIIHITNIVASHTWVAYGRFCSPRIAVLIEHQRYSRDSSAEAAICSTKWTLPDIALRFQSVNYCGDTLKQREVAVTCELLLASILTHSNTQGCAFLMAKIILHRSWGALLWVSLWNFGPLRHTMKNTLKS